MFHRRQIQQAAFSFAIAFMLAAGSLPSAQAQVISRNNPYRSFNVSGINYGSVQWQKAHGGFGSSQRSYTRSYQRRWFRR